jgi:hypothetical protein
MYRCQLDRHTLDRLVHSAGDGIPGCDLRLTTRCDGIRLTAVSLDQLESDVCDSRHVDNLQIGVTGQGRRVTLAITPRSITVVVADPDALWARGKLEQLRSILRRAGGRDRPVRWGEVRYAGLTALIGVLAMVTVVNAGAIGNGLSTLVVAALTVLTLVVAAYATGRGRRRRARTHICISGPLPRRGWWERMTLGEKVGWLATSIAAGSILVKLLDVVMAGVDLASIIR